MQLKRWATKHKEPVFRWYNPIRNEIVSTGKKLTRDCYDETSTRSEALAAEMHQLRMSFVRGAPCYVTKGLNPNVTGIVNGLKGRFLSLTWSCGYKLDRSTLSPGEVIEVPIPYSVNIILDDNRTLPMIAVQKKTYLPRLPGQAKKKQIAYLGHDVEIVFAITFHKLQ